MANYTSPRTFVLTIDGDEFKPFSGTKDITSWFTPSVSGLTFTATPKDTVSDGYFSLDVAVSGKPGATSSSALSVTVPISDLVIAHETAILDSASPKVKYNITVAPSASLSITGDIVSYNSKDYQSNKLSSGQIKLTLTNAYWSDEYAKEGVVLSTDDSNVCQGPFYFYALDSSGKVSGKWNLYGWTLQVKSLADSVTVNGQTKYRTLVVEPYGTRTSGSSIAGTASKSYYAVSTSSLSTGETPTVESSSDKLFKSLNTDIQGYTGSVSMRGSVSSSLLVGAFQDDNYYVPEAASSKVSIATGSTVTINIVNRNSAFVNPLLSSQLGADKIITWFYRKSNGKVISGGYLTVNSYSQLSNGVRVGLLSSDLAVVVKEQDLTITIPISAFKYPPSADITVDMGQGLSARTK